MTVAMAVTFGDFLKQVRKRAGMTQDDLAAATGYSRSLIAALERNRRLPDIDVIIQTYLPALGLQDEPLLAAQLVELAALARSERPPAALTLTRERQVRVTTEIVADRPHLPIPPTALLGRDQAVHQLCQRLLGHHGRLLTLVGPPGVGKTRLAQAVGTALQHMYQDGAVFVPLAAVSDPALVASTLVTALKLQDGSSKLPQSRLIEYLRRKEILLLLDNFEQISAAAPLVAELLVECAGLRVLVTSRERLHLRAEQRYKVPPLELAAAVELFEQRAAAVEANFRMTAANRPLVEAICQRLDRLPLAIELCAAQTDLLSPTQLLAHLQAAPLDLLVAGAHDLPPQQRTLRTAIHHSYRLLNETERTLFRSLGVFVGGFDLAALEIVSAWPQAPDTPSLLTTLHALIGKSLVYTETLPSGEPRFLLLETIREFALEQARAHDEEARLRQRHYTAYLHLFRTGDGHLRGAEMTTWMARLAPEQDNFRAAWQWTVAEARYADARWLSFAGAWFWNLRGQWYEQGRWLAQLLPHRHQLPVDLQLDLLVDVYATGRVMEEFQPLDRWKAEMRHVMAICTNQHVLTMAWHFIACFASDFTEATAAHEQAIAAARRAHAGPALGPEWGLLADCDFQLGSVLWAYALGLIERGEFTKAMPLLLESRAIFQQRGNRYDMADSLGTLGFLAFLQGDLGQAHTYLQEAVTLAVTYNLPEMRGLFQPLWGLVTLYNGNALEARQLLNESLRLCLELKERRWLARICTYLAEVALWAGELGQAEQSLAQSLVYEAMPRRITAYEIIRFWVAARLATAQEQFRQAAMLFGLAEAAHSQVNHAIAGPVRERADAALATVRAALDPAIFAETFATGQQMALEHAFATILAPSHVVGNVSASVPI